MDTNFKDPQNLHKKSKGKAPKYENHSNTSKITQEKKPFHLQSFNINYLMEDLAGDYYNMSNIINKTYSELFNKIPSTSTETITLYDLLLEQNKHILQILAKSSPEFIKPNEKNHLLRRILFAKLRIISIITFKKIVGDFEIEQLNKLRECIIPIMTKIIIPYDLAKFARDHNIKDPVQSLIIHNLKLLDNTTKTYLRQYCLSDKIDDIKQKIESDLKALLSRGKDRDINKEFDYMYIFHLLIYGPGQLFNHIQQKQYLTYFSEIQNLFVIIRIVDLSGNLDEILNTLLHQAITINVPLNVFISGTACSNNTFSKLLYALDLFIFRLWIVVFTVCLRHLNKLNFTEI